MGIIILDSILLIKGSARRQGETSQFRDTQNCTNTEVKIQLNQYNIVFFVVLNPLVLPSVSFYGLETSAEL